MPEISLTSFTDYVLANGPSKLTRVGTIMDQLADEYSPARDHYRGVREGIIAHHDGKKDALDKCVAVADKRRVASYTAVVASYKAFLRRNPPSDAGIGRTGYWEHGDLTVRVNPEIRLELPDGDYFIKLYFKAEKVSKPRADVILHLMKTMLPSRRTSVAVLDVREGRLFPYRSPKINMGAYLAGEAAGFSEMWRLLV